MGIISICVISTFFSVAKLLMLAVLFTHPVVYSSYYTLGVHNDCFERVSIGKRLHRNDISRSVTNTTLKQCDVACERETCNAYSYGIGPSGNGTCDISLQLPNSAPNEDPDYDLFIRVLQCRGMTMCFKRMVNGRKIIDRYIRRTFPCDSLARCQLACTIEREFICEGFNYRFGGGPELGSSCQLSAMPGMNLDLTLDFTSDVDYDFYTRDRNAPASCGFLSYKTWNPGYPTVIPAQPNYGQDDYWLRPTPIPQEPSVSLQPRVDLNDIYNNKWNSHGYECFIRARTGFRLHTQVVVMTLNAPTLYDCEYVCANERKFMCNILSYRYSSTPNTDNCMLGEKTIKQLEFYYDLVPERDYDVYIRNEYSRPGCQPTRTWDTDCFERIRTGIRIDPSLIRFSVNTDSLIDCELICLHVRHFTCRAFSFRYGIKSDTYNCLLSDYPIPEMDPGRHFVEDGSCELYHRGSYGHGCEIDKWSQSANPNLTPINRQDWNPATTSRPPYPLKPTVITVTSSPYPYNPYGNNIPDTTSASYVPQVNIPATGRPYLPPHIPKFRPTKPILPASPTLPPRPASPDYGIIEKGFGGNGSYMPNKLDKICYIAYGTPARLKAAAIAKSVLVVNEQECKAECSRARQSTKFRCASISYWSGHCELSDIEMRDLKQDLDFVTQDTTYWLFTWDFTNPRCFKSAGAPPPIDGVWSSYTVSGRPCKFGTQCSLWKEAGVWSCPVEDGDWDYCCRPDHHCGFSEGYSYPWCYVGHISKDQWRPCNDQYYPYQEHQRGAVHWPVSYVHRQGPPNDTTQLHHQPSLVDSFFDSLKFAKEGMNSPRSADSPIESTSFSRTNTTSILEFQVVDVTDNMITNITTPPKIRVERNSSNENEWSEIGKVKRSLQLQTPNIT